MSPSIPPYLSARAKALQPFHTIALLTEARARIAAGQDVIRLDVGEPDFPTPAPVVAAAAQALAGGAGRYTESSGTPALRQRIAAFYGERYGVAVDPRRVIVTTGSSAALWIVMALLVDQGDTVLTPSPAYPSHSVFASASGGELVKLRSDTPGELWPTLAQYGHAWQAQTRGVLVASPSNPTGSVLPWDAARALIDLTEARGGSYISDEIYHGLSFDGPDHTALEHSQRAFVINSFSKYFSMTGWRLGWVIVPPAYVAAAEMMAQHFYLSAPDLAQQAALACFDAETLAICEQRRLELKARRDYLLPALESLGLVVPYRPDGGFYIFADVSKYADDGYQFCRELLEHTGVSLAPGLDFGPFEHFIRFSYCTRIERLQEAVERIRAYLQQRVR